MQIAEREKETKLKAEEEAARLLERAMLPRFKRTRIIKPWISQALNLSLLPAINLFFRAVRKKWKKRDWKMILRSHSSQQEENERSSISQSTSVTYLPMNYGKQTKSHISASKQTQSDVDRKSTRLNSSH